MDRSAIVLYLGLFVLFGCSNISSNQLGQGSFVLNNGHFDGKELKATLEFKHFSWFKEAMLIYDMRIARLAPSSPYFLWLSAPARRDAKRCAEFYIGLFYAKSHRYISHSMIEDELTGQGASIQLVPDFFRALKMHPEFELSSLRPYRVKGICFKAKRFKSLAITLPGYSRQVIVD